MELDGKSVAQRFALLTPEKRAAFIKALAERGISFARLPIVRAARHAPIPLSYAQQRLWFLMQLDPSSAAYNMPAALRLRGELDTEAVRRSLEHVISRHEALRTTFRQSEGGEAEQVIHAASALVVAQVDLSEVPESAREEHVQALVQEEACRAFDLERGPLLRVRLLRLGARDHVLLVTLHHIGCDAWSMDVLVEEFARGYAAYCRGEVPGLAALPIQYADYALWQRQWMEAGERERQFDYWRLQLGEQHPVLELPADRARRAVPSERGAHYGFALEAKLTARLRSFARAHEVTLPMVLLAAFKVLLYRYTGQGDLRVGVPVANRHWVETEGLIGFFVNTQVWRTQFDGRCRVAELLARVRETALGAQAHQDLPFEQLVEALQPVRSLSHNPLFQVMYNHQAPRVGGAQLELAGLRIEALAREVGSTQFDLTLDTQEEGDGLSAALSYRTELFERSTIARMAGHWRALLRAMVEDPGQCVGTLPLLTQAERFELLAGWNTTERAYPFARGYVGLFEARVAAHRERIAASCLGQSLSYGPLNAQANRAGHALIAAGVRPDDVVALLAERGLELLGLIVGVFKAGAGYLPLDPRHPVRRLAQMLSSSRARVIVSSECFRTVVEQALAELPPGQRPALLTLETLSGEDHPAHDLGIYPGARHLAYVIYTSGSTGVPKGVMVEQAGMLNNQLSKIPYLSLTEEDVIAQTAAQSFDISVWQFLTGLLCGARVEIVPDAIAHDPVALLKHVNATGITVLESVPSLIQGLLACEAVELTGLRWLLPTGEALPPELARQWFERYSHIPLVNAYGPAECSDDVALHTLRESPASGTVHLPIGRPTDNTRLYVLDGELQPVPVGVTGELCIAGIGVGRGYIHDPVRTAQAFVPHPYAKAPGERLYRSGDGARWRADGVLEYVGRTDHQVKVRGFRIELGEIEARLLEHKAVREAVVLAREAPGGKQLVGYVVPTARPGRAGLVEALKAHLKEALPEYMVPAQLVVLESLPLTPNGKLDRKALPEPEWANQDYVAPRTELERQLAGIWQAVLGIERIGATDNFFELGGHSLLATQVVSRVRKALDIELPLRVLFEASDLGRFAARVQQMEGNKSQQPPLEAVGRDRALPPSYAQSRLWFLWQLEPESAAYHMAGAVRLKGVLDSQSLQRTFDALVERHEGLRTTFRGEDGQAYQVINEATPIEIALENLGFYPEAEREAAARALIEEEAKAPFDLEAGPLFRVKLLRLAEQDHVLLVTMHHVISDGWSMNLVIEEFAKLYEAYSTGIAPRLPELPIQYADYALWQRQWLEAGERERQLAYWRAQLGDHHPVLELATDRLRPALPSHRGASHGFTVDAELTQRLKAFAQAHDVTLFMLLLAAFSIVLKQRSGQSEFLVGTDVANRNRPEIEPLVGFFVNQLVLKVSFGDTPTLLDLLKSLRSTALGAFEHQDLPFEHLIESLRPERRLGRAPLFTVKLIYQEIPISTPTLPNLVTEEFPVARQAAELDLVASFTATESTLHANLEYAADLFEEETIACIGKQALAVLQRLVADPDVEVEQLQALASEIQREMHREITRKRAEMMRTIHPLKRRPTAQARPGPEMKGGGNEPMRESEVGGLPWRR